MLKTIRNRHGNIYAWLLFSCLFLAVNLSLKAQLLESLKSEIWIRQIEDSLYQNIDTSEYIGNYPVLNASDSLVYKGLYGISREKTGTLFLVLKLDPDSVSPPFLKMGTLQLYRDSAVMDHRAVAIPSLTSKAVIVRLYYQGYMGWHRSWLEKPTLSPGVKVAEAIYFKKLLSPQQARVVYSYLAMKYSINITSNTNPNLRDYLDIFGDKTWDAQSDQAFDEQVMALGRLDRIGFYQSQTFTADNQKIQLSLSDSSTFRQMPDIAVRDSSLLIFAKDTEQTYSSICGGAPSIRPWKIKLVHWQSSAANLYITLDTLLQSTGSPVLTTGSSWIPLTSRDSAGKTTLTIPLPDSLTNADWYVAWDNSTRNCRPVCHVRTPHCPGTDSVNTKLHIAIDPQALPATLNLANLQSHEVLQTIIEDPNSEVQHLGSGQYQLVITHDGEKLADQVFVYNACPDIEAEAAAGEEESMTLVSLPFEGTNGSNSNGYEGGTDGTNGPLNSRSREINVYPNPGANTGQINFGFSNLNGQDFTIDIMDGKGRLLAHKNFTPKASGPVYRYSFKTKGFYLVRFSSGNYVVTKNVIIN